MSDFVIKEDSKLYELLKSKNLLDENKIKEKIETCLDFEDFIFDVDDMARLCLKPELYKKKIENMAGEELKGEAIKALNLTNETIYNVIDFIEDRFGKLFEISEGDYILIDDFPKMTALKYVGKILPIIMQKYLQVSESDVIREQTKRFVKTILSTVLGKAVAEKLNNTTIKTFDVFLYNRLRSALSNEEVNVIYLMFGQDKSITDIEKETGMEKQEIQRIEALGLRVLRQPRTIASLKSVIAKYN